MILDSSALVALLLKEPGSDELLEALCDASEAGVGAPSLVESGIVLASRLGRDSRGLISRFLAEASIVAIPFSEAHWATAVDAWLRFGKGRHPAGLNFGDCLAYATAKVAARPLLCVGADFSRTDIDTSP